MSRIGNKVVTVPKGVAVVVDKGMVSVKGPKGQLSTAIVSSTNVKPVLDESSGKPVVDSTGASLWKVHRASDSKSSRAFHGLMRSLFANMVIGVSTGFEKSLEIVGVGYKAELNGKTLVLHLGYSHTIDYPIPTGITIKLEQKSRASNLLVVVSGSNKEQVGQVAAEIRGFREPDSYKGKGVRYVGEIVRLKAGKTQ
jgi:large subunit ribosomal protein L6